MKPLLSGTAATIVGILGTAILSAAALLPAPWAAVAGLVGFLACALSGLSAAAPSFAEGRPVVQGAMFTAATALLGLLSQFYAVIPAGWPQSVALALAGLLALLTGKAMPALGTPSAAQLEAATAAGVKAAGAIDTKAEVISVLGEK